MSWQQVWTLPRASYSAQEVRDAVRKATAEFEGVRLGVLDPDSEEFADDFDADDDDFEFVVLIPPRWLSEEGDEPSAEPSEDGYYLCVFSVDEAREDSPESSSWRVVVESNESQNRDANLAVSAIASRVSVHLGGSHVPLPL